MVQEYISRFLSLKIAGVEIRTALFEKREHIVVPVIALVEGVIHAINADSPELVLAEELAKAPQGWNGRPIVGNHPASGDMKISANAPRVLEENAFGIIFNTKLDDTKLKLEAWLDPEKAEKTGNLETLERIKNGEMVEVSVGVFVINEKEEGVHKGKNYNYIWRNITPDHLAMLPEGSEGACNNEMGCGAPRTNQGKEVDVLKGLSDKTKALIVIRSGVVEELSDVDLRNLIDSSLRAIEPGYMGIEAVFESTVVYSVMPEDAWTILQRDYTVKSNEVNLGEKSIEVKPVTRFEPVTAQQKEVMIVNEEKMKRIKALIENPKTVWDEEDAKFLETLSDCKLTAMEKQLEVKEPNTEPKIEVKEVEKLPENMTEEEWLKVAPENLCGIISEHRASEQKKHEDLVKDLSENQKVYKEEELKAMSTVELENIQKLITKDKPDTPVKGANKFDGKPLPRTDDDKVIPDPPSVEETIKAARAK